MEALEKAKPIFNQTKVALLEDLSSNNIIEKFTKEIQPGESINFIVDDKNAAISYLSLNINGPDQIQTLRSTVISLEFDGQQTVWVPVGGFFGTGYQMLPHKTWVNQTGEEGWMKSSWLMPYQDKCIIRYHNFGK